MYKILIAEDEAILREGLADELKATGLFDVADLAANGEEALRLSRARRYDAVILDIRMPKLDGIGLLKALASDKNPAVKVILSGYADFTYAKKGIEYGVSDYIVKPLKPDSIRNLGERIAAMIAERDEKRDQLENLLEQEKEARRVMGDLVFLSMKDEGQSGAETERKLLEHGITLPGGSISAAVISPVKKSGRPEAGGTWFLLSPETAVIVFPSDSGVFEAFAASFTAEDENAIVAVSDRHEGEERLREAWMAAGEAFEYAQLFERTGIVRYNDIQCERSVVFVDELDFCAKLGVIEENELSGWIEELFGHIPEKAHRQDYYSLAIYIAMICRGQVRRLPANTVNLAVSSADLFRLRKLKHIKLWTFNVVKEAHAIIGELSRERGALEVKKVIEYIDANLAEDLSMADLAEIVYLSQNYLGKLFIGKTGMTVSAYVNRRRIEKACALLRDGNLKFYDIAEQVGIHDPNYFSSLFRKHMGMSPTEYVKRMIR